MMAAINSILIARVALGFAVTGMKTTRIVIAGGGFAGLYAAMHFDKRLARRADVEVTLISRENFILFTPMLHEVAAGDLYPGDIVNPLMRPGGILIMDGALAGDKVADPTQRDADTVAVRDAGRLVRDDEKLTSMLVPLGDGLLAAVKLG